MLYKADDKSIGQNGIGPIRYTNATDVTCIPYLESAELSTVGARAYLLGDIDRAERG